MGTEDFVCWEAGLKRALIIIPVQAPLPEEHNPCAHRRMGLVISAISLQPFAASQHIRWPGTLESHWAAPSPVWALSDEEKTPEIVQSLFSYCPPSTLVRAPLEPLDWDRHGSVRGCRAGPQRCPKAAASLLWGQAETAGLVQPGDESLWGDLNTSHAQRGLATEVGQAI